MLWYEALMAFVVVMTAFIAPSVAIARRRKPSNPKEIEDLRQRVASLEQRLTEEQDESRRLSHEVEFVTRLIEQKGPRT